MIIDLLQIIINYSGLKSSIYLSQMDKYVHDNIHIHCLYSPKNYALSQQVLDQRKYSKLKILLLSHNGKNILDINNFRNTLEYLQCNDSTSQIDQKCISELRKLKVLICNNNPKINNIDHLSETLEKLCCMGNSGISQTNIFKLNKLKSLKCSDNTKINNVNHLTDTLIKLYCGGASGVDQDGISKLSNLRYLNCVRNIKINNVKGKKIFPFNPWPSRWPRVNHLKETLASL